MTDPDLTWAPSPEPSTKPHLPGEPRPFRDLTPPQHLTSAGRIESRREQEVSRGEDPLLARVRELEKEVQHWKLKYKILVEAIENHYKGES